MIVKKPDFKISKDQSALLACIGISLLIWFFVKLSNVYTTRKEVGITYILPPMMEFTGTPPSTLIATVSASGFDLAKKLLFKRYPAISIDLAKLPEPAIQRHVLMSKVQEELGLPVVDINRNYLSFSLDSTATKKVPVKLNATLSFNKDFFPIRPPRILPDSVVVAGPAEELQGIDSFPTQAIAISGIAGEVTHQIPLETSGLINVKVYPPAIKLLVSAEQYTEKSFDLPVRYNSDLPGLKVKPLRAQLTCSVGISRYDLLTADSFLLSANPEQPLQPGKRTHAPLVLQRSPRWVKAIRYTPKTVEFLLID